MNIDMIRAAAIRLEGHARRTPLLSSPFLDEIAGKPVFVKAECLQHTGSFKFRGGWSALSGLPEDQRKNGVIAFSSGNHAQGVAYAAALHGVSSVIIMPSDAPRLKIENTRALGAEVVLYDRATEDRDEIGATLAKQRGLTLIKPYDEPLVIAGQGTTGLEIAAQAADLGVQDADVLVPVPLMEFLINTYSNEGELVVDNCMGSGTTGVACKKTGRHFIGIEKDEKYFEIAVSRVSAYCG